MRLRSVQEAVMQERAVRRLHADSSWGQSICLRSETSRSSSFGHCCGVSLHLRFQRVLLVRSKVPLRSEGAWSMHHELHFGAVSLGQFAKASAELHAKSRDLVGRGKASDRHSHHCARQHLGNLQERCHIDAVLTMCRHFWVHCLRPARAARRSWEIQAGLCARD